MLVGVLDFDDAVERRDTKIQSESDLKSKTVGSVVIFLNCTLREGEDDLEEAFCHFLPRTMIEKKGKRA